MFLTSLTGSRFVFWRRCFSFVWWLVLAALVLAALVLAALVLATLVLAAALVLVVALLVVVLVLVPVLVLATLVLAAALVLPVALMLAALVLATLVLGPLIASVRSIGHLLHLSVHASKRLELKKRRRRLALQKYLPHLFLSSFHLAERRAASDPTAFVASRRLNANAANCEDLSSWMFTTVRTHTCMDSYLCGDVPGPHPS